MDTTKYDGLTAKEILALTLKEKKESWRCDNMTQGEYLEQLNTNLLEEWEEVKNDPDAFDEGSDFSMLIPAWKNVKKDLNREWSV